MQLLLRLVFGFEMLGGLDCAKSYFLGLCQKLLSEESPKSLKLSGFYKSSFEDLHLFWRCTLQSQEKTFESISKC